MNVLNVQLVMYQLNKELLDKENVLQTIHAPLIKALVPHFNVLMDSMQTQTIFCHSQLVLMFVVLHYQHVPPLFVQQASINKIKIHLISLKTTVVQPNQLVPTSFVPQDLLNKTYLLLILLKTTVASLYLLVLDLSVLMAFNNKI